MRYHPRRQFFIALLVGIGVGVGWWNLRKIGESVDGGHRPGESIRTRQTKAPPEPSPPVSDERQAHLADNVDNESGSPARDEVTTSKQVLTQSDLKARRDELNQTVWSKEIVAQQYESALVALWDALLAEGRESDGDQLAILQALPLERIVLGHPSESRSIDWGIQQVTTGAPTKELDHAEFVALVEDLRQKEYRLVQSEWHHSDFKTLEDGTPQSTVSMLLHLTRQPGQERHVVRGNLIVQWSREKDTQGNPIPYSVDASQLELLKREGATAFEEILTVDPSSGRTIRGIHPLMVYDIDRDGLSEILLGGCNQLCLNLGNGNFRTVELCAVPNKLFEVGLVADLTGDGIADFVAPGAQGDMLLYRGDADGRFSSRPIGKAREGGPLRQPQALTTGDIDGDGDLDLWVGQYLISYVGGQMPTPYYDANDGLPAFLLVNQGEGRFEPLTEEAGLSRKRFRRTYTASFVDLDNDDDLDLLVVSDFAGIDVYFNDGHGYFSDVTDRLVDERHLFGMSASFGDYDMDGQLDFFVTGMASTTARRLDRMRLGRKDRPNVHLMRSRMGYGNRMYLRGSEGFYEPEFRDQVARTGWTWGTTSFDFDNDGDRDIYVANGHSSGKSTKDHCTHFWCHDIYEATSKPDRAVMGLFQDVHKGYLDRSESWDGYQKNVLLMNLSGKGFTSIAFLMGVAMEYDARAVVSDDLDGDGLVDLLVTEDKWTDGQVLHVYRNRLETDNNWIGVRLREEAGGRSPVGAKISVHTASGPNQVGQIVTGDSIHAQHATTMHFGLGSTDRVQAIEIRWRDGWTRRIENPAVNQYHAVSSVR